MTTDPYHQKDDSVLEQDIGSIRSAWADQAKEEPPGLLDQAVMNRAKRELEEPGKASRRRTSIKWLGAFATAAVVVLALTVVLEQEPRAPIPSAQEADGLRLDSEAPPGNQSPARLEAVPQKARAEPPAEESLTKQLLRENVAPAATAATASAENNTGADAWIKQLLELKKARQFEKLTSELARFRSVYPDYPLPPELEEIRP